MQTFPEKPLDSDCCGSGCMPCVFDVYEKILAQYNEQTSSTISSRRIRHDLLSPIKYKPFKLSAVTPLNENTSLYSFAPVGDNKIDLEGVLPYSPGQHFILIDVKSDFASSKSSISRAYTPISVSDDARNCSFQFFVKLYENGRMSSFFRGLCPNDVLYMRGAFGDFKHERNSEYVMICAGTGIAPMYAIIKSVLKDECDETLIRLCWACSTLADLVFRDEIREFCKYWNFKASFYLSKESETSIQSSLKYGEDIHARRISFDVVKEQGSENMKLLICGSEKFNADISGHANRCGYKNLYIF